MFNPHEITMLQETLYGNGFSEEDANIVIGSLHPYSQHFSTANGYFKQLNEQILSFVDMDDILFWIQWSMSINGFDDENETDVEYNLSQDEDEDYEDYDDYDDY